MKYTVPKNIKEKRAKRESQKIFWKVFFIEGAFFLITSFLATVSALKLNKLAEIKKVYLPAVWWQDFLFSFLFVAFFILVFISYKKAGKFKEIVYKGLFIIAVFWGGMTVLNLFMPVFATIFVMGVLIILWLELPTIWVHDILMVLGLGGAASFFGLEFAPSVVVALLLIFSVYDFIAVYRTKHTAQMAKEMIEKKVVFGFIIPKEVKSFAYKLNKLKINSNFIILRGGDVVLPGLLASSIISSGFARALIVILFSFTGSFFSYWLLMAQKDFGDKIEPVSALPPIALFSIIGYLITLLF